ncbi:MAG: DMT family transporter [Meiothermus sp.]|nr:DMT family transporter [Meiothermus sp.]
MQPIHIAALLSASIIWGGGFALNRVAAPYFGPIVLVEMRLLLAGLLLLGWAAWLGRGLEWRKHWKLYLVLGATNAAIPFAMIAYSVQHIGASFATIINSTTVPLSALLALWILGERLTPVRLAGMAVGLLGVVVLVGWSPVPLTLEAWLGIAAMLLASVCFAFSNVYTKRASDGAPLLGIVTGQLLMGAALFVPPSAFTLPSQPPPLEAWLALLGITVLATAMANLLYFYLIEQVGPLQASSVGFLVPMFGVLFGVVFLREPFTWSIAAGMALILLSVALVSGVVRPRAAQGGM